MWCCMQALDIDGNGFISHADTITYYDTNGASHGVPEVGHHRFGLGLADADSDEAVSWTEFATRFDRLGAVSAASMNPTGVREFLPPCTLSIPLSLSPVCVAFGL
jgi:hypothetical protein